MMNTLDHYLADDATRLATAAMFTPGDFEPAVMAIHQSTIFGYADESGGYGRRSQPNRTALEETLAALEGADEAVCFPSGMAAIFAVLESTGASHVILPPNVYGGIYELLSRRPGGAGPTFEFVDPSDRDALDSALRAHPGALLWLESPSNPTLDVYDIRQAGETARRHGALLAVDNTLATPLRQKPLLLGADIVVHSTSKYLAGHSDVIGGAALTTHHQTREALRFFQNTAGLIPAPYDCWLTSRGLRTLALRIERQEQNALALAGAAGEHSSVTAVYHPSTSATAKTLVDDGVLAGYGGLVSICVGEDAGAQSLMRSLRLFHVAASLGGVESTVSHPATMSHRFLVQDGRSTLPAGLLRFSLGVENAQHLVDDLIAGLDRLQ